MVNLILLNNLQQLEDAVTFYCQGKSQRLVEKRPFNFLSLLNVYNSIKLLPLDSEKIALMERFQQNIIKPMIGFHPKLYLSINFTNEINTYKPLIEQLNTLQNQALELFKHYFDEKPRFDWEGLRQLRAQIYSLANTSDKTQLMQLFQYGVLATITQIEPKAYSALSFDSELVGELADDQSMTYLKIS
ncbi:hypothetical protein LEAN103870_18050 [Legionella anisa]|uniref:Uncharacterized protein n=1 Tax=Legionella anisa TaxID=28082 RepID=A0AAX0WSM8_9GAMM|nr:hypothetical protein [Legionella anisa]AWN75030.1 hypothetical protein DLD14_14935 [Legionella anisa]KTC67373.1 hypothetical protein Lani_3718 [Legionella anisa]MBN5933958.1 hypothetical protein [Legionella anisa]MCW8424766.1 hypothetical protein [Legionella anisa]MCW8446115.1 hypothetical protein [Legionella anisa]